jgi:hypothetical protein
MKHLFPNCSEWNDKLDYKLQPSCSEEVLRINLSECIGDFTIEKILEQFNHTLEIYKTDPDGYARGLRYMKHIPDIQYGTDRGTVFYCSRLEGGDDWLFDLKVTETIYSDSEIKDAESNNKVLELKVKKEGE